MLTSKECKWIFCPFKIRDRMKLFMKEKYTKTLQEELGNAFKHKQDKEDSSEDFDDDES